MRQGKFLQLLSEATIALAKGMSGRSVPVC
jgi:hypothetical protein